MSISFSSFSLYEFLRILFPGTYLLINVLYFINYFFNTQIPLLENPGFNHSGIIIIYLICSFILGVLIYSIDNPKLLRRILKNSLPVNLIEQNNPGIDSIELINSYFIFYDKLPGGYLLRAERQIGFFHISLDLLLVNIISLILILICIISGKPEDIMTDIFCKHTYILIALTLISFVTTRLIYSHRLKEMYERNLKMYYKSEGFNKLLEKDSETNY